MANRRFDRPWCIGPRRIPIVGSFVPLTTSGTVVASTVSGFGFGYAPGAGGAAAGVMGLVSSARPGITGTPGIVRAGTGLYTVTLDDSYLAYESILPTYGCPVAGLSTVLIPYFVPLSASFGVAGAASSFQIVLLNTSGTPADAAANCLVSFQAWLRDSTVQFSKP